MNECFFFYECFIFIYTYSANENKEIGEKACLFTFISLLINSILIFFQTCTFNNIIVLLSTNVYIDCYLILC